MKPLFVLLILLGGAAAISAHAQSPVPDASARRSAGRTRNTVPL